MIKMSNQLYSHKKFKKQLEIIMQREGILTWQKFEKEIGMPGAAYRWKTGKDQPTPESLLKISRRFGVSIDWLLVGEEPVSLHEFVGEPYEQRRLASVQPALLGRTISLVRATLKDLVRSKKIHKLTEDQEHMLIAKVYAQCGEDLTEPDRNFIEKYLLLID